MLATRGRTGGARVVDPLNIGDSAPGLLDSLLVMAVGALLVWRLMIPPEGSVKGETLWVTLLWPLALAFWGIAALRAGAWQLRWNWLDVSVWCLAGGHILSALWVIATEGDKRAATNMLWEWLSLGISFFLARQVVVDRLDRRNLAVVLVGIAMAMAGLGIYQHFIGYRDLAHEYDQLAIEIRRLDRLNAEGPPEDPRARTEWEQERNEILIKLHKQQIPPDRRARMVYEQRLKASTEPYGMFALANTFAGFLVCLLVPCVGTLVNGWRQGFSRGRWAAVAVLVAGTAFCLLLTKSRTAYGGLIAGLSVWGFTKIRSRAANPRAMLAWGLGGLAVAVILGVTAWATGGMDRLVLSESGKSLRYRLEYWRGTWGVLRESAANLLIGVGPGNFRQHYLVHKLPESSEEVADPHNMLLDAWANGGLAALSGLGGICVAAAVLVLKRNQDETPTEPQQSNSSERKERAAVQVSSANSASDVVINGFLFGGGLGFLAAYVSGAALDNRILALAAGWGVSVAICSRLFREIEMEPALMGAAVLSLLVHLLGAGGLGMPAITQTLLVLLVLGFSEEEASGVKVGKGRAIPVAGVAGGCTLALGCLLLAVWPVKAREDWLATADAALSERRNADEAAAGYARAAAADPWSAEPLERQATIAAQRALAATDSNEAENWMQKAVAFQESAIARDPLNASEYRLLADRCLEYGQRKKSPTWLERAALEYTRALSRYPNNPELQADLAVAWSLAGRNEQAKQAARRALELHEINVRAGHPDKQLPVQQVRQLRRIAEN